MWLRNTFNNCRKKEQIIYITLGLYIGAFLWFTLFNRAFTYKLRILPPLWSYKQIAQGDMECLRQNIENILLFIPAGYFLQVYRAQNWKRVFLIGFCVSFSTEMVQLMTTLGCFEFDDLFHNTIGVIIGWWIYQKVTINSRFLFKSAIGLIVISGMSVILLFSGVEKSIDYYNYRKMVPFAALSDTAEHKNLLVLNGTDGFCWDTNVFVKYEDDGSLKISGMSDKQSWYRIGDIKLDAGTYVFSGLTDVEKDTVALYLVYYDESIHNYRRLVPDIGPRDRAVFKLEDKTKLRVYVMVYENCSCDVTARPVIYEEEWNDAQGVE